MPRVKVGDLSLNYIEYGEGDNVVLAVHGNLGCADWLELVLPLLPQSLRVIAAEWRGCGDSDKPEPAKDYSNYTMDTHAHDMLGLIDVLGIGRCGLYGHSTGGIIVSHMLTMAPERFGKVLMLDPVTPMGLKLLPGQTGVLKLMRDHRQMAFAGLASAAPTLFRLETLIPGQVPLYAATTSPAQRELFEKIIDKTRILSDGIWFGTPHNLALEWKSKALAARMPEMKHKHLIIYGQMDSWIPWEHIGKMVRQLHDCRLEVFPYIGHSMNLEVPTLFARIFSDWFQQT